MLGKFTSSFIVDVYASDRITIKILGSVELLKLPFFGLFCAECVE